MLNDSTLEQLAILAQSESNDTVIEWLDLDQQDLTDQQKRAIVQQISKLYTARQIFDRAMKILLKDTNIT